MPEIDIKDFTRAYSEFYMNRAERLGQGGFGKVYLLISRDDKRRWAAKYQKQPNEKQRHEIREEVKKLLRVQHDKEKYVMAFHSYFEKREHTLLVTEYLAGGELFKKIAQRSFRLTEQKVVVYVKQIIKALNFVHSRGIVHLDIKPQNIMLKAEDKDTIKLIDFGLAKKLERNSTVKVGFAGTIGFMAPEVLKCTHAAPQTDFFSLGVVAYMLLSGGHEPFWKKDDLTTVKRTLKHQPEYHVLTVSREGIDFIDRTLRKRVDERLFGEGCLEHAWIRTDEIHQSAVLDNTKFRSFQARRRWNKAIKAVRMTVRMRIIGAESSSMRFHSQEIPIEIL